MRWMSPSTDGERLVAVHTPHIGGVLHAYRHEGSRLESDAVARGVSNHSIGSRTTDVSAWAGGRFLVPDASGEGLRVFDLDGWREGAVLALPGRVRCIAANAGRRDAAVLLEDGTALRIPRPG